MKRVSLVCACLVAAFVLSASVKAEETKAPAGTEVTGTVGCAHCQFEASTKAEGCSAAIKVGDVVYSLKASDKADAATKAKITNYKKELVGNFTVKGTISEDKKTLTADSVTAAAAPGGAAPAA